MANVRDSYQDGNYISNYDRRRTQSQPIHRFNPMALNSLLNEVDTEYYPANRSRSMSVQQPGIERPSVAKNQQVRLPYHDSNSHIRFSSQISLGYTTSHETTSQKYGSSDSTRPPRPPYSMEMRDFIWYHRTDLGEGWDKVLEEFNINFRSDVPRPKSGLQCIFYRVLNDHKVAKVREQSRASRTLIGKAENDHNTVGAYGVVQRTARRYEWMLPEHRSRLPLPQFRRTT